MSVLIHPSVNGQAGASHPAPATPSSQTAEDALRVLLRRLAGQVLTEASGLPALARAITATAADDVLTLTILVTPTADKTGRQLSPCERDILAVMEQATVRLSTSRMIGELERRGLIHGESTISRALIRMVKLGLIRSSRRAPRGYYLPGKYYPLFSEGMTP